MVANLCAVTRIAQSARESQSHTEIGKITMQSNSTTETVYETALGICNVDHYLIYRVGWSISRWGVCGRGQILLVQSLQCDAL